MHAGSNATSLSTAIIDALASDAASVNEGLGDVPAFAQLVAQQMSKAQVPQDVQIAALGRAIATVLVNCSHASSCNTGSSTRFAGITQAAIIVDIAVAAGLRNHFRDIFAEVCCSQQQSGRPSFPAAEHTYSMLTSSYSCVP